MELPIASQSSVILSAKQSELIGIFQKLIVDNEIKLAINPNEWLIRAPFSLDVEHDEAGNLVGIGLCKNTVCLYFTTISPFLRDTIEKSEIIAHNGLSDFECLRQWGINVKDSQLVHDTMLFGHVLDSSLKSYGLKDMSARELQISYPSYDDIVGKRTAKQTTGRLTLDKQPIELVAMYNALDCFVTYRLYLKQFNGSRAISTQCGSAASDYFNNIEKPVSEVFTNMSDRGIRVDLPYLASLKTSLEAQQAPLKAEILNELGSINLNSPKQLLEALHAKEIYPELKGKPSTDKRALSSLSNYPVVCSLLQYSELATLLSSFIYPYLERGTEYVHPFFNQVGTRTGRPSCSNPNLLQIPKRTENGRKVRRMFIPRNGMELGDSDLSGIEPRMLAVGSNDPAMLALFNSSSDFHDYFAKRVGVDRPTAKVFDLETYYRATKYGVARTLNCDLDTAQKYIDMAWELFPTLRRWEEKMIFDVKKCGYLTTLFGRKIKIEGLDSNNEWKRTAAERQLMNNWAQGSAAEVMKMGMLKVSRDKRLNPQFGLLIQVYDQLIAESPTMAQDLQYMKEDMETAVELSVPLVCEAKIGPNWADVE